MVGKTAIHLAWNGELELPDARSFAAKCTAIMRQREAWALSDLELLEGWGELLTMGRETEVVCGAGVVGTGHGRAGESVGLASSRALTLVARSSWVNGFARNGAPGSSSPP